MANLFSSLDNIVIQYLNSKQYTIDKFIGETKSYEIKYILNSVISKLQKTIKDGYNKRTINLKKLIETIVDRNLDHESLIDSFYALIFYKIDDKELYELFINNKIDINYQKPEYDNQTPLAYAIELGRVEIVKILVELGADTNETYKKNTALEIAELKVKKNKYTQIANYLKDQTSGKKKS